jgi:hypothetical protein
VFFNSTEEATTYRNQRISQLTGRTKGLEEYVAKQVVADFHARPTVYGDAAKGEFLDVAFRVCLRQYLRNT